MIIAVPRERKTLEKRVALTPSGAAELTRHGHKVLIEKDAGAGSHFPDEKYRQAGCEIVATLKELWNRAELIVKVKEPDAEEYAYFRPGLAIFDYLHLAGLPEVARAMLKGGVTGIAYELVKTADGRLPLLEPMSQVAGKLAVINGAYYLLAQNGGRGLLPGSVKGAPPAEVVIVGAGIAGRASCQYALGLGAAVTVLDINQKALAQVESVFAGKAETVVCTPESLTKACAKADLLVGAVLVPGAAAPKVITRSMIQQMKPGTVFVDISVDQGGCAETTRTTSLKAPVYVEHNVTHYAVPNMPAQTPLTSTAALTSATFPYLLQLADQGVIPALKSSPELRAALNTHNGKLTNQAVGQALNTPFTAPEDALL